jgi:hypothetical protein
MGHPKNIWRAAGTQNPEDGQQGFVRSELSRVLRERFHQLNRGLWASPQHRTHLGSGYLTPEFLYAKSLVCPADCRVGAEQVSIESKALAPSGTELIHQRIHMDILCIRQQQRQTLHTAPECHFERSPNRFSRNLPSPDSGWSLYNGIGVTCRRRRRLSGSHRR